MSIREIPPSYWTKNKKPNKLKKKKQVTVKALQGRLWSLCKQIIRAKYKNVCFTCGKSGLEGSNWHTGHFLAAGNCGTYLKYDLRNLRPQCYNCNINLGGNGAVYYQMLVAREGQAYVDQLFLDKRRVQKGTIGFYQNLIDEYTGLIHTQSLRNTGTAC